MDAELNNFIETSSSLKSNDKYIINRLSVLAMSAKDNPQLSKDIAKVAITNIFKASANMKLTFFYVVDSIIKNIGTPYKEMFAEKIIDAFINTFQSNKDHKMRIKLYNLRLTWKDYFQNDLMHRLDEDVKEFDPAWPLVTKFVPKSKSANIKKVDNSEIDSAKSSPDSTTPTVNRDPRLQKHLLPEIKKERKRKSADTEDEDDLFTIDRRGNNHIKNVVRKMGRLDEKSPPKDSCEPILFGLKDIDLRITDDRCVKDKQWTSEDVFAMLKRKHSNGTTKTNSTSVPVAAIQPILSLPAPREPTWRVPVEGFPQLPHIGTDPRLLDRCPFYDPLRTITIDGRQYLLYLDRLQPCIFVNNELHAVRFFYPDLIELYIDNAHFVLSTNGLTHIKINRRFYVACLGGPGHELILNGWPYNARIDGKVHQISVGGSVVNVQFLIRRPVQVNIQHAIPPYVCEWAVKLFFGSPQYLNIPPLNPLINPRLHDIQANAFREQIRTASCKPDTTTVSSLVTSSNVDANDFYQKPHDKRIIKKEKLSEEFAPDVMKYSWDIFKTRNVTEITNLQSGHQCDLCGTRFRNKDSKEFELHLDYHFYKNTSVTSTRKSRNYVGGSRQWILGGSLKGNGPDFNLEESANCDQRFRCPMFEDEKLNKCAVCMEGFETVWDDDEDSFMLLDGQLHNDKVYHPICLEDADKQIENCDTSMNDADKSQIELTDSPLEALEKVLQGKSGSVMLPKQNSQTNLEMMEIKTESQEFNYESANT